jgi:hypothetical protein
MNSDNNRQAARQRAGLLAGGAVSAVLALPAAMSVGVVLARPAAAQTVISGSTASGINLANYTAGVPLRIMAGTTIGPVSGDVLGGAVGAWSISNAGALDAAAGNGVRLNGGGAFSNGPGAGVSASGYGVLVENQPGSISNAGTIAAGYDGISLNRGGSVSNLAGGTISGGHIGVYTGDGVGSVANGGLIMARTGDAVSLYGGGNFTNLSSGRILGGYSGVYAGGADSSIQNAGIISGPDFGVYLTGAQIGVRLAGDAQLVNSGTISGGVTGVRLGAGGTLSNGPGGVISGGSVGVQAGNDAVVRNVGVILDDHVAGIVLGSDDVLSNSGSIGGVTAILVNGSGTSIVNTGTVSAAAPGGDAILLQGGSNVLTLDTGAVVNGEIDGAGTGSMIVLAGTGTLGGGIADFGPGSSLALRPGADWTASGNWVVASVDNQGVLQPGEAGAPLNLTGDFSQGPGGTLRVVVTPAGSSHFNVDGAVQLGGALDYVLAPGEYAPASEDFLTATGPVTGSFASVSAPQAAPSTPPSPAPPVAVALAGAQAARLVVTGHFTVAPADAALFADAGAAMAMDAQGANAALLAHAGGTPSGPCAPVSGSGPQAAMEASLAAEFCRAGGWVEATGSRMVVQGGYHEDAAGFLAGIDHAVGGARLGLAVGEWASALDDASGGKAKADTLRVGFYGALPLGSFTLSADVTDGFATRTTIRETGADAARGRDHGNVLAGAVQLARPLNFAGMQLLPAAGVQAAQVRMGRMDEVAREQAFALQTAASGATSLRPYLSLDLSEMLVTESQLVIAPQASLGVTYEAGDPGHAVRLTADDGTLFSAGGRGMQGAGGQAMAAVSAGRANWSLNARYTADLSGGWSDQSLEAGLQIRW